MAIWSLWGRLDRSKKDGDKIYEIMVGPGVGLTSFSCDIR
jgi:hypothetical protein